MSNAQFCKCPEKNHQYTTTGKCRNRVIPSDKNIGFCWRCIKKYEHQSERSWPQLVAWMNIKGVTTPEELI